MKNQLLIISDNHNLINALGKKLKFNDVSLNLNYCNNIEGFGELANPFSFSFSILADSLMTDLAGHSMLFTNYDKFPLYLLHNRKNVS